MRRRVGWVSAAIVVAFLLVLAAPDHDRALALYAFLLLVGALALAALLVALAATPQSDERRLLAQAAPPDSRPDELDMLESAVRATLAGNSIDETLYARVRTIVAARLARGHGISLERDPALAHSLLGEGLVWALVSGDRGARRRPMDEPELTDILATLEAL